MNLNIVVVFLLLVIIGLLLFPMTKTVKPIHTVTPAPKVTEKYHPVVVSTSGKFPYPDNVTNASEGT